jgi:hypothetical protein
METAVATKPADLKDSQLVEMYVQLRDRRAQRKAAFENSDADDKARQEKIEGILLKRFEDSGLESIKTAAGTAYKSLRSSASIADWDTFLEYIKANDAWELLTKGCNKTSVVEFKQESNSLPPGINWREEISIGVRRA